MVGNKFFNKLQIDVCDCDLQVVGIKVLLYLIEVEQLVLGGLMLDNECWDDVVECVVVEDFYICLYCYIFMEMGCLQESGSFIDLIMFVELLEWQG